jgi:alkylhydroperoxidase family enzyme
MAPRLRQVSRAEAAESVLPYYDLAFGDRDPVVEPGTSWGTRGTWWTVLALVPDILNHTAHGFPLLYRPTRKLDPRLRELAVMRAGWARESRFVFLPHCKNARDAGVTEAQIQAIPSWSTAECFSPIEGAVLAYTDALVFSGGRVSDATFAALQSELSDEEILELTYAVSLYQMQAIMSRALRLESDDRDDPIVEERGQAGPTTTDET